MRSPGFPGTYGGYDTCMISPRIGGILGQADTSAANIDEVCTAVKGGKSIRAKIGPYRVTRTMYRRAALEEEPKSERRLLG